jgi:hypothetical protein
VLAAEFLKVLFEQSTHSDDSISHTLDFAQPLLVQLGVVQDLCGDASTVDGRIRVERSNKNLDLRVNTLLFFSRFGNNREGSDTLSV